MSLISRSATSTSFGGFRLKALLKEAGDLLRSWPTKRYAILVAFVLVSPMQIISLR